jgi:hypothetical protein
LVDLGKSLRQNDLLVLAQRPQKFVAEAREGVELAILGQHFLLKKTNDSLRCSFTA